MFGDVTSAKHNWKPKKVSFKLAVQKQVCPMNTILIYGIHFNWQILHTFYKYFPTIWVWVEFPKDFFAISFLWDLLQYFMTPLKVLLQLLLRQRSWAVGWRWRHLTLSSAPACCPLSKTSSGPGRHCSFLLIITLVISYWSRPAFLFVSEGYCTSWAYNSVQDFRSVFCQILFENEKHTREVNGQSKADKKFPSAAAYSVDSCCRSFLIHIKLTVSVKQRCLSVRSLQNCKWDSK